MLLLGYILVTCHKNNIVTLHVTFMLYRRNKTCLLGMHSTNLFQVIHSKKWHFSKKQKILLHSIFTHDVCS